MSHERYSIPVYDQIDTKVRPKRLPKRTRKRVRWLWRWLIAIIVMAIFIPAGVHRADVIQRQQHKRWGKPITGEVISTRWVEEATYVTDATIRFHNHRGQTLEIYRLLPVKAKKGDRVKLWDDPNDFAFVSGSYRTSPEGSSLWGDSPWREDPWPRTEGTFVGYLVAGLVFVACLILLVNSIWDWYDHHTPDDPAREDLPDQDEPEDGPNDAEPFDWAEDELAVETA